MPATKSKEPTSAEFTVIALAGSMENRTFQLRCRGEKREDWNKEVNVGPKEKQWQKL